MHPQHPIVPPFRLGTPELECILSIHRCIRHRPSTSRRWWRRPHRSLMAEAAALALAAIITERPNLHQINFLSDNQQLVHFLNASDQANPPDWRIKYFTQLFSNYTSQRDTRIFKIQRPQNQTADILARQALLQTHPPSLSLACNCSYSAHVSQCPIEDTLRSVALNSVRLLIASCCWNKSCLLSKKKHGWRIFFIWSVRAR